MPGTHSPVQSPSLSICWIVKTMTGQKLDTFASHADAVQAIEAHQRQAADFPEWNADLRIIREKIAFPLVLRTLFYGGGTVGLGHTLAHSYFWMTQHGKKSAWSVFETLARIHEFSLEAQVRILGDCAAQIEQELELAAWAGVVN